MHKTLVFQQPKISWIEPYLRQPLSTPLFLGVP